MLPSASLTVAVKITGNGTGPEFGEAAAITNGSELTLISFVAMASYPLWSLIFRERL